MKICLSCEGISATELQQCGSCGTELLPIEAVHYPLRRGEEDAGNPLLGSRIDGKFRITNVLGKGGMGTVFRAVHEVSLVPVALKILHARYAVRGAYREGFLAEARKAGRVVHENCARILDVGEAEDGTVYIAQELVEGETLDEWIHAGPGLAPATAVEILVQLCRALVAAHAVGLVHRDLSTRNIMVLIRDGRPLLKVLDFGIAKGAPARRGRDEGGGPAATASFANPAYSAPEQLAGKDVDARADLYSLGVIAYEGLCGELPVAGATGRELARATMEGRLKALPSLTGVPVPLHRLVERLLARDPKQRPASAAAVLEILERLRRPRDLGLKRVAVGLLIAAVVLISVAYSTSEAPDTRLDLLPGPALVLENEPVPAADPAQELHSRELDSLSFEFAGFDPTRLQIQAFRGSTPLPEEPLAPEVDGSSLTLSTTDPVYAALVQRLADQEEPVDLIFRAGRLRRYARVLVDDAPPELALLRRGNDVVVLPDTIVAMSVDDVGAIEELGLELRLVSGQLPPIKLVPGKTFHGELPLGELLAKQDKFQSAAATDETMQVWLYAVDGAGNRGTSDRPLEFSRVDLRAPVIREVSSPSGGETVTYGQAGTTLSLVLDGVEPELTVRVWDPSDTRKDLVPTTTTTGDDRLDLELPAFYDAPQKPFQDGVYRFQLEDRVGNLSDTVTATLFFRPRDVQPFFSTDDDHAAVREGLLVTDGEPAWLHLRCNEAYRLEEAVVRRGIGAPTPVTHRELAAGSYALELAALDDGPHTLSLTMRDLSRADQVPLRFDLWVIGARLELRLPDTSQMRFLPELLSASILRRRPEDGALEEGAAWRLTPPDRRLLRGQLWFGNEQREVAPRAAGESLFGELSPAPGQNRLDLALRDPLGRPVDVFLGDKPAELVRRSPDMQWRGVAAFHYPSGPAVPRQSEVRVESDQPAHLVIYSPVPFTTADGIRLNLSGRLWSPLHVDRDPGGSGGTELEFELPFADLLLAIEGLDEVDRRDYGVVHEFPFTASLETPAGEDPDPIRLPLRTSRSLLPEVLLGDLADQRQLPEPLLRLRMVPALAPPSATYADPVPDLDFRSLYRPAPVIDVRNTKDVYLQGAELTREQYQAAVQAFLDLAPEQHGAVADLVHASDPLGADRLSEEALVPASLDGQQMRWQAMLEQGDRPVTGLNFFQAYTVTRILGQLVAGNPELLRLPLGVELEMAALGAAPASGPVLNGLAGRPRGAIIGAHRRARDERADPARWPPTAAESQAIGDYVTTDQSYRLVALDFGVREWVLDLPYNAALDKDEALLREWMADHSGHVQHALELARGVGVEAALNAHLATFGVVRGVALGEPDQLIDGASGEQLADDLTGPVPPSLPGVVRVLQLRRDGRDLLPNQVDPRLALIGLRLAGGDEFVRQVRAR